MPRRAWEPDPSAGLLPGDDSDRIVAEAQGVTRDMVRAYRERHNIPPGGTMGRPRKLPMRPPYAGNHTDAYVAAAHGVPESCVWHYRDRYRIPPAGRPTQAGAFAVEGGPYPGEDGPDPMVAAAHGVSTSTVYRYRARRRIPAWRQA